MSKWAFGAAIAGWTILVIFTLGVFGFGVDLVYHEPPKTAAEWGDFVGGFGGGLAFLWLIASIQLQRRDLKTQLDQRKEDHEEFEKQRAAMEAQQKALEAQVVVLNQNAQRASRASFIAETTDAIAIFESSMACSLGDFVTLFPQRISTESKGFMIIHSFIKDKASEKLRQLSTFRDLVNSLVVSLHYLQNEPLPKKWESKCFYILENLDLFSGLPKFPAAAGQLLVALEFTTDEVQNELELTRDISSRMIKTESLASMDIKSIARNYQNWKIAPQETLKIVEGRMSAADEIPVSTV